jgi:hypothetical protein
MKCGCGKTADIHWVRRGDYCSDCFYNAYNVPLLESMTEEEKERRKKITENFQAKASHTARGGNK